MHLAWIVLRLLTSPRFHSLVVLTVSAWRISNQHTGKAAVYAHPAKPVKSIPAHCGTLGGAAVHCDVKANA